MHMPLSSSTRERSSGAVLSSTYLRTYLLTYFTYLLTQLAMTRERSSGAVLSSEPSGTVRCACTLKGVFIAS